MLFLGFGIILLISQYARYTRIGNIKAKFSRPCECNCSFKGFETKYFSFFINFQVSLTLSLFKKCLEIEI